MPRSPHAFGLHVITLALGVLLLSTPLARAQAVGSVEGRVVDQTGGALPGVAIDLTSGTTELTAISDARGVYRFDAVAPGPGELTFRLINYAVLRRHVVVSPGKATSFLAVMPLALSADVIVTGTATFRNVADIENPVASGAIGRFGLVDPSDRGKADRQSVAADFRRCRAQPGSVCRLRSNPEENLGCLGIRRP